MKYAIAANCVTYRVQHTKKIGLAANQNIEETIQVVDWTLAKLAFSKRKCFQCIHIDVGIGQYFCQCGICLAMLHNIHECWISFAHAAYVLPWLIISENAE